MPNWTRTRYFGINRTTPGTASRPMNSADIAERPAKCNRANAYPASESKNTRPMVTKNVTMTEFRNHCGKSAAPRLR